MNLSDMRLTGGTEQTSRRTPLASFVLAYAGMLPVMAGSLASLMARSPGGLLTRLTIAWSGAILCFLSGVRRGLSFRQEGGSTVGEIGSTVWTFVLGAGALLSGRRVPSIVLLLLGFGSLGALDASAARKREAPRYFIRLRPAQMAVSLLSLAVLLAAEYRRPESRR